MNSGWLLLPVIVAAVGANAVLARSSADPARQRFHRRVTIAGIVLFVVVLGLTISDLVEWLARR